MDRQCYMHHLWVQLRFVGIQDVAQALKYASNCSDIIFFSSADRCDGLCVGQSVIIREEHWQTSNLRSCLMRRAGSLLQPLAIARLLSFNCDSKERILCCRGSCSFSLVFLRGFFRLCSMYLRLRILLYEVRGARREVVITRDSLSCEQITRRME